MKNASFVLIWGYGRSGRSVEEILIQKKIDYKIYDKKYDIVSKKLYLKPSRKNILDFDLIVVSPAVNLNERLIRYAKSCDIPVVSELEFGYWFLPDTTNLISITGTNGKTTTTSLLVSTLQQLGLNAIAAGNIGNPLSEIYKEKFDYVICETSSFQLEAIDKYKSKISVLLNLFEDHIDRHKTFENYIKCKLNIFKNNTNKDIVVINFDDEEIQKIKSKVKGNIYYISREHKIKGVYIDNKGNVINNVFDKSEVLFAIEKLNVPPIFYDNYLAAILCILLSNVNVNNFLEVFSKYAIMSHRYEYVTTIDNVKYINDSKATNTHSVIHSVKNTKNDINLLLGGVNKKLKLEKIFDQNFKNIVNIIAFGKSGKEVYRIAKKYKFNNITYFKHLKDAIMHAHEIAKPASVVLLSPGCASFDEFLNYTERGNFFKNIILKLEYENEIKKD